MLSVLSAIAISLLFFYVLFIFPLVLVRFFRRNPKSKTKINRLKTVDEFDFFKQVQIDNERGYCDIYQKDLYKACLDSKGYRHSKTANRQAVTR